MIHWSGSVVIGVPKPLFTWTGGAAQPRTPVREFEIIGRPAASWDVDGRESCRFEVTGRPACEFEVEA